MRFRKDLGVALAQLLQYLAEFHGVGPVAGVGFVKQGDMIIAADQQPQTDLSQIDAASLVLAAPGEPGRGTSVDVGEEVGGVVDQGGGVDAPIAHQHLRDFLLDGLDGFEQKFSHVVEKALAAQLRGIGGEQSIENGPRVPVGQLRLGCGRRSEEHTSELQSPDTISYAVFCLKKKKNTTTTQINTKFNKNKKKKK